MRDNLTILFFIKAALQTNLLLVHDEWIKMDSSVVYARRFFFRILVKNSQFRPFSNLIL